MKILFIGGTGTISMAASLLALENGHDLFLLNRGHRNETLLNKATFLNSDINDEANVNRLLEGKHFDCVVDFIAYDPKDIERDYRYFKGRCGQYIFISSASAYQKPPRTTLITEETPLENPYWEYSRKKIDCENLLREYGAAGFPFTIVRPSHTYDERKVPTAIHGHKGSYQILKRMQEGKPIILFDNGESLWTLTHSRDFAKGLLSLFGNPLAIGQAFHITSDEALSWNEIYRAMAEVLNVEFRPFYVPLDKLVSSSLYDLRGTLLGDKAYSLRFDNAKLKKVCPDFVAAISYRHGIKETVENILSHPELQTLDPEFEVWCDEAIRNGTIG